MAHPTINAAANTIGVDRTTLIEQLRRLETDLGQPLYHRATADGGPQRRLSKEMSMICPVGQISEKEPDRTWR
jgi:hypothetical protein